MAAAIGLGTICVPIIGVATLSGFLLSIATKMTIASRPSTAMPATIIIALSVSEDECDEMPEGTCK